MCFCLMNLNVSYKLLNSNITEDFLLLAQADENGWRVQYFSLLRLKYLLSKQFVSVLNMGNISSVCKIVK